MRPNAAGLRRLFRSAGVRLALAYAGLFALSVLTLMLLLWWATIGLLNAQVDAAIRADAQVLSNRWQNGGDAALLANIEARLAGDADEAAIEVRVDLEVPAEAAIHWRAAAELHAEAARLRARAGPRPGRRPS